MKWRDIWNTYKDAEHWADQTGQRFGRWLGEWSEDNLNMLWDFLNGRDLNYWVAWSGIYYSFAFLIGLSIFMIALRPRVSIEKAFTWLMISFCLVLVRVIYVRIIGLTPLFWSTLIWVNLSLAITYTGYTMITDKFVRRRALSILPGRQAKP